MIHYGIWIENANSFMIDGNGIIFCSQNIAVVKEQIKISQPNFSCVLKIRKISN